MKDLGEFLGGLGVLLMAFTCLFLLPRSCTKETSYENGIKSGKTFILNNTEYKCAVTNQLESGK